MSEDKERLTATIALRVYPFFKEEIKEEAKKRNMSISDLIYECVVAGYEIVKRNIQEDVKQ